MTNKLNFRNFCDTLTCHNTHNDTMGMTTLGFIRLKLLEITSV